jgi:hypothetical protein
MLPVVRVVLRGNVDDGLAGCRVTRTSCCETSGWLTKSVTGNWHSASASWGNPVLSPPQNPAAAGPEGGAE